jgi:hypothetical protein
MALTITTAIADSFKKEILMGAHLFKASGGHTFKMLLLKAAASGAGTYGYSTTNVGTPGPRGRRHGLYPFGQLLPNH